MKSKITSRVSLLQLILLSSLFLILDSGPTQGNESPDYRSQLLISAEELKTRLSSAKNSDIENLLIIDVRAADAYNKGHIEGAVNLPVDLTFNQSEKDFKIAPPKYINNLFSRSGINSNSELVLYDDGEYKNAARLFWVLEVYGHKKVALLDGGLNHWKKMNFSLSTHPAIRTSGKFFANIQPSRLATKLHTRLAIDDARKVIVDVRDTKEYNGLESRARKKGHIPSAINIPATGIISDDQNILKRGELAGLFSNIPKDRQVVTYCHKGKNAAFSYFALRVLGYEAAVYDGSWFEWGNSEGLPISNPTVKDL